MKTNQDTKMIFKLYNKVRSGGAVSIFILSGSSFLRHYSVLGSILFLIFLQAPACRAGPAIKLILCCGLTVIYQQISRPLIGWKYECYIVIEVIEVIEVDELDEGKKLSSSSTSMTISVVAGKQKKNNESLNWAVPH